jgi:hypothetical protein
LKAFGSYDPMLVFQQRSMNKFRIFHAQGTPLSSFNSLKSGMLLFGLFFFPLFAAGQQESIIRCAADELLQEAFELRPELIEKREKMEAELQERLSGERSSSFRSTITIPVVFHVVWNTAEQNISDLQIYDQLEILNQAYNMHNRNLYTVPPKFRHLIADAQIEFCLAARDPSGNPTNGITRTQTDIEEVGSERIDFSRRAIHFSEFGGKDHWDPDRYLNVWVCEIGGGVLGSATFPQGMPYPEAEGVLVDYRYVGSIGTATESKPYDGGKTLVHETGHYFNLFHPWGPGSGSCDVDDFVDDTPTQIGPYFSCDDPDPFSCDSEDIVTNFMDYPEDNCLAMFTLGQRDRMIASLELHRAELLESNACIPPAGTEPSGPALSDLSASWFPSSEKIGLYASRDSEFSIEIDLIDMAGRVVFPKKHNSTRSTFCLQVTCQEVHILSAFQRVGKIENAGRWSFTKVTGFYPEKILPD